MTSITFQKKSANIIVLQKGQGPPGREPVFNEEQKKQMMAYAYRKQEELKVSSCDLQFK